MDTKAQKNLYDNLKRHPQAYITARNFVNRLLAGDPKAVAELKRLSNAPSDPASRNALQITAIVFKFEHPDYHGPGTTLIGGLPGIGKAASFILSPVAWALSTAGKAVNWTGSQIQHLGKVL